MDQAIQPGSAQAPAPTTGPLTFEELQLASRNHAMPLEAMQWDVTPAGLHYLVVHWDVPKIDVASWRLVVGGTVRRPLELTLDDLRARPRVSRRVTLECAGNGRARLEPRPVSQPWLLGGCGTADWTGTPLGPLLAEAGLGPGAKEIVCTGADRGIQGGEEHAYARSLSVADATGPSVMLAYEMNGQPLPVQHGFPLRLLVPGWYGMASVKWLTSIQAVTEPFDGFQQSVAFRFQRDQADPGEPVSRMRVRALMIPPGIPDFATRTRLVPAGPTELSGRAWSGGGPVSRVEVGVDGIWSDARVEKPSDEFAWSRWSFTWDAPPGEHEVACRATDSTGDVQPTEQRWNYQGMGNNAVLRVAVTVSSDPR